MDRVRMVRKDGTTHAQLVRARLKLRERERTRWTSAVRAQRRDAEQICAKA